MNPLINPPSTPGITFRRSLERGHAHYDWLDTYYTFSFANYYDHRHIGFRNLVVINEDRVAPGKGFGTHPHRNAEIFTLILKGQLQHRDSMGNGRIIHQGELQYMSAGDGVQHSEFNPSDVEPVHLLQIWLKPDMQGGAPHYEQKSLDDVPPNAVTLLASPSGREDSIPLRARAEMFMGKLDAGHSLSLPPDSAHPHAWLHVFSGTLNLEDTSLAEGDAASWHRKDSLEVTAADDAQFLLFRMA